MFRADNLLNKFEKYVDRWKWKCYKGKNLLNVCECVWKCKKKKAPSIFPLHERWQRGKIAREIAIRRRLCVVLDPTVDASLHSQLIRFKRAGQKRDCSLRENLISVFDFSSTHNYTQAKEERIDKVAIFIFIFILFSSFLSLHLSALPLLLLSLSSSLAAAPPPPVTSATVWLRVYFSLPSMQY